MNERARERIDRIFGAFEHAPRRRRSRLPPGPRTNPWLTMLFWARRPIELLEAARERYGPTFTLRLPVQGPIVIVTRPEDIRDVFTASPEDAHAGEAAAILEPLLGKNSVILLDGDRHARERRMLMPPFHGDRIRTYGDTMHRVAMRAIEAAPIGRRHPILSTMQRITLDVIMTTVFGLEEEGARLDRMRGLLTDIVEAAADPLKLLPWPDVVFAPFMPWGKMFEDVAEVDRMLAEEVARRRREGSDGRHDVLAMLVAARDEDGAPMTDIELRDEMVTLLVAGHETTATTLSWACSELLDHPDIYEKLEREVDAATQGGFDAVKVAALPYLDAVVKETLRRRPILPLVGRRLQRDMTIGDIDLPKGAVVGPCVYLAHHRAENFADPYRFDPARFLAGKVSPYAFFPFGGGGRRCIGMAFALFEAKVVLATLVASRRIERVPGHTTKVTRRAITLAPSQGMPLVLRPR